jgi:FkbM family methyltransferase
MRVYFIDIGAWIGDMAIEYAVFAKQRGASFKADCYDPSRSGQLIPYNIAINKLDSSVRFFPVAAGLNDGYNIFNERWGHSDSSHLGFIKDDQMSVTSHIVETKTLSQMLPTLDPKTHIIVKIDVEGIDAAIVMQTLDKLRDVSLIVEFAPWQQQYDDFGGAAYFIEMLRRTHTVFDVHPVTRPVLVRKVQDSFIFEQDVRNRDYGYTDILAIPHRFTGHDEIVQLLNNFSFQQ